MASSGRTSKHLQRGRWAETKACDYLDNHGLRLLARNYRSPFGEIDLIMADGQCLAFVEVRYRTSRTFGYAGDTVDQRKQAKLRASAEYYVQRETPGFPEYRFDVLAITKIVERYHIDWIKDAF